MLVDKFKQYFCMHIVGGFAFLQFGFHHGKNISQSNYCSNSRRDVWDRPGTILNVGLNPVAYGIEQNLQTTCRCAKGINHCLYTTRL